MNWRFCVIDSQDAALELCGGSMGDGIGYGDGSGDGWGYGNDYGDGWGDSAGYGDEEGSGSSPEEWR